MPGMSNVLRQIFARARSPQSTFPFEGQAPTSAAFLKDRMAEEAQNLAQLRREAHQVDVSNLPSGLRSGEAQELLQQAEPGMTEALLARMPAIRMGGSALGGTAGYLSADEDIEGDRLKRTMLGAALGGAVGPGALQATLLGRTNPDRLTNYLFYSYLSSPDTVARANLGAIGGALNHAFEEFAQGLMTIGSKEGITHMDNAWRVMESVPEAGRIWQKTLFGKEPEVRALRKSIFGDMGDEAVRFDVRSERFRDVGLGRLFSAGDNAAVYALKRAGLSTDQAMRMTLAGTPETPMGKAIVNTAAKGLRSPNWLTRFGMSAVAPFARVATVGAEQGLKRFPGVGHFANALGMEHAPLKTRTARQLLGGAGLGAGYMLEGTPGESKMGIDPRITQTMGTAAGAAFLPFQFGRELRDVAQRTPEEASLGSMTEMGLKAFGNTAKEFSPLGFSPLGAIFRPQELPGRLIPAGVSDIAEAMDPAARRETGAEALQQAAQEGTQAAVMGAPGVGRFAGRLPWLREQLPEAFAPVDWKGDPLLSSSIALPGLGQAGGSAPGVLSGIINRSLLPAREQALPPIANMENPQLAQLSRMGLEFNAPSPSVSLPGMAGRLMGKIPMDAQTTAQVQKMRGQGRQASVDMLSQLAPLLERLPEPYRSRMMQLLQSRVEQPINRIESAAARALALSRTPRV